MGRRVFHVLSSADHAALCAGGEGAEHRPASLEAEGFVHCSFPEQLADTLRLHFRGAGRLALLELDPAQLRDALRIEPSRGGALFPHLYRALRASDVRAAWPLAPEEGFALPRALFTQP